MSKQTIKQRLEEIRQELRAQRISYGELVELRDLASHIEPSDIELLEAAGVPEFDRDAAADTAEAITERVITLLTTEPVWQTENNGDIRFTDTAQEIFNLVYAILEADYA